MFRDVMMEGGNAVDAMIGQKNNLNRFFIISI
jgi:gamma-glutamyltranspeptidase